MSNVNLTGSEVMMLTVDEYHDRMDAAFERGVTFQRGRMPVDTASYDRGWSEGYDEGLAAGERIGYDQGREDGDSDGYHAGYEDGSAEGYQRGYSIGHEAGEQAGQEDY
jgi:flagellar biosynthesis/type III secretory pathway protein FliH